jgi:hypothetical protein
LIDTLRDEIDMRLAEPDVVACRHIRHIYLERWP